MENQSDEKQKQKYEKPRLRFIELATDEVMAIGCKTISGQNFLDQPQCGIMNSCVTLGS